MNILEYSKDKMRQCLGNYEEALQTGSTMLAEDLKSSKNYEHDSPKGKYEEKDEYFNRANIVGYPFLTGNLTGFSKDYYWRMFQQIVAFEKSQNTALNKGMVCANWGISDLAEGDIDGGIAHLFWAGFEDRGWSRSSYTRDIFNSPLYRQFAEGTHRLGKSQFGSKAPYVMLEDAIQEHNNIFGTHWTKDDIFRSIGDNDQHRSILDGALWALARNLPIYNEESPAIFKQNRHNIYTRLRLFNGLIDLCRFIELRIRYHEKPPTRVRTLGNLIHHVFENEAWFPKEVEPLYSEPQTATDFNDLIKRILKLKQPAKCILSLWVTRNYSVHVSDADLPDFFENVEKVFSSILGSFLFYLMMKKII